MKKNEKTVAGKAKVMDWGTLQTDISEPFSYKQKVVPAIIIHLLFNLTAMVANKQLMEVF